MITCASDILPGPTIITTSTDASKIKSNSNPPLPIMLDAPLTMKIAPNMMMEINDADNLLRIPIINKIPGTNSANANGICISTGSPMLGKFSANPGLNFEIPCSIKITPMADLKPMRTISFRNFSLISAVVNMSTLHFPYNYFAPELLVKCRKPFIMRQNYLKYVNVYARSNCCWNYF